MIFTTDFSIVHCYTAMFKCVFKLKMDVGYKNCIQNSGVQTSSNLAT